jgi:MoxR-like ATPase
MDARVEDYIVTLVDATRRPAHYRLALEPLIRYGASPRATIYLAMAGRAHALLAGRGYVLPEDIKAVAPDVLRHRLIPTYEAEALGRTPEDLLAEILKGVPVP